jgi:hypothetical protein
MSVGKLMIVSEMCLNGSLNNHLLKMRNESRLPEV